MCQIRLYIVFFDVPGIWFIVALGAAVVAPLLRVLEGVCLLKLVKSKMVWEKRMKNV